MKKINFKKIDDRLRKTKTCLSEVKIINKADMEESHIWKTIDGYYQDTKTSKSVLKHLVTIINSLCFHRRRVFFITRDSLRILIASDTNHLVQNGLKNEHYGLILNILQDENIIKTIDKVKTNKGHYIQIYEVIDEGLIDFLSDIDPVEQHNEILSYFSKRNSPKSLSSQSEQSLRKSFPSSQSTNHSIAPSLPKDIMTEDFTELGEIFRQMDQENEEYRIKEIEEIERHEKEFLKEAEKMGCLDEYKERKSQFYAEKAREATEAEKRSEENRIRTRKEVGLS